ncbi:bifunctional Ribosomal protein L33/Ribosomal protein L33 superfamily/Zinc-binding ribosomal protein [Babesia duncani]|uniref:Bifunctional Ribosomal protein L33/Ribosomal protein L33 superfamily/Zinc-binding ribosomal protein n=1 Tax=Babesia duncani TaxID=323732 RepID=A0AAD9PMC2_9APIC|nr:bifunctional Ribosomal protein L33/Ribosomal protein L33 superfamily/Zinc-binding ribosomal protein [Babesia duncani]
MILSSYWIHLLLVLGVVLDCAFCWRFNLLHAASPVISSFGHFHFDNSEPFSHRISPLYGKKKAGRVLITLECTEARKLGMKPSRYYTTKNKVNTPERLQLMKYNPYLRRHTLHKEIK